MRRIFTIALKNTIILYVFAIFFDSITYAFCFTFAGIARSDIFNKLQGTDTIIKANIITLLLCSTLLPLLINVTKQIGGFLFSTVQQNISNNIKIYIYDQIFKMPINKKNRIISGEIMVRFRDDVQDIVNFFSEIYNQMPKLFMSIINLFVMLKISRILFLVVVIPLLIIVCVIHLLQERLVKNKVLARKTADKAMQFLGDMFDSIDAVKLSSNKINYLKHYSGLCKSRGKYAMKDAFLQKVLSIFSLNLMFLALAAILFFTYSLIKTGVFTIGNFILFEYYFWFLTDLPSVFSGVYGKYKQMFVARQRIVELDNLDNTYNQDMRMLETFKFEKGCKYLITGKNGSGKSILLKNIFTTMNSQSPHVCYLSQSAFLISGTVQQNICLGLKYDSKKIDEILEFVCLDEDFSSGMLKMNSIVGNCGDQLSGGQRKRLALARLLYRDPTTIILDDVTSGLDIVTEKIIMQKIKKLKKTVIIASNNENLSKYVDYVINL